MMAPVFSRAAWRCVWYMIQVFYWRAYFFGYSVLTSVCGCASPFFCLLEISQYCIRGCLFISERDECCHGLLLFMGSYILYHTCYPVSWILMLSHIFYAKFILQNDLIHAWGLDYQLGYCSQASYSRFSLSQRYLHALFCSFQHIYLPEILLPTFW